MGDFYWTVHDSDGSDLSDTPRFDTKEEAESFMGTDWSRLVEEGGHSATLKQDGEPLYRMGLTEQ
jgi:hypothetical protein